MRWLRFSILLVVALTQITLGFGAARAFQPDTSNTAPKMQSDTGQTEKSAVNQLQDLAGCPTSGSTGVWGRYSAHDLPHGHCSGMSACSLWTKDSCPATDSPGPAIKWNCTCASGTWQCDEQERSKTICPNR